MTITKDGIKFITRTFEHIPTREHKNVLAHYIRIAETERPLGDQFAPVARANHYLHEVLGKLKKVA